MSQAAPITRRTGSTPGLRLYASNSDNADPFGPLAPLTAAPAIGTDGYIDLSIPDNRAALDVPVHDEQAGVVAVANKVEFVFFGQDAADLLADVQIVGVHEVRDLRLASGVYTPRWVRVPLLQLTLTTGTQPTTNDDGADPPVENEFFVDTIALVTNAGNATHAIRSASAFDNYAARVELTNPGFRWMQVLFVVDDMVSVNGCWRAF